MTELIIMEGIREKATDIHINPFLDVSTIFYRVDGVLQHRFSLPKVTHGGIVSRTKIMSQIDIAETRLPQDGSFSFAFLDKSYDIRSSTVPTIYGENVVMRILAGTGYLLSMKNLDLRVPAQKRFASFFRSLMGLS